MRGNLFIISAPSGAGKSSISNIVRASGEISLSVSCTTRPPRTKEADGAAYFFLDEEEFLRKSDNGELLECARVHGNWYGTPKGWVEQRRAAGEDILLEIDWNGARQVRKQVPEAISVFVLPPSLEQLRIRLQGRAQDGPQVIKRRLAAAPKEIAHAKEYDYVIINKDLQASVDMFLMIVRANRLRYSCMESEVSKITAK